VFDNFATQIPVVGPGVGVTAAEIASVQDDNTCFQGIASGQVEFDASWDAVRQYRITSPKVTSATRRLPFLRHRQ
jgi:hypothetical protein